MGKKILVVDDEPTIVKMLESRLKADSYEVLTAYSGEEGLEEGATIHFSSVNVWVKGRKVRG